MYKINTHVNEMWLFKLDDEKESLWVFPSWKDGALKSPAHFKHKGKYSEVLDSSFIDHNFKCLMCGEKIPEFGLNLWKTLCNIKMRLAPPI